MLELRELYKEYPIDGSDPVVAIAGVSLHVARGECVALYGPSGSGKTTLIELIAGVQAPDRGSVLVDGRDVSRMSRKQAAEYRLREVGMIMQPHTLIPGARAVRNASLKLLMMGVRDARSRVEPLLGQLGLAHRLQHRTEQLSMGERQRVLIALALSASPKLLLADEPTASLDTHRTREVLSLLRDLAHERGMALVLATHDPEAATFADSVHELRDGQLLAHVSAPEHSAAAHRPAGV